MIVGVIPARYASTRLPGKPLIDLCGQTMIERVWRAAQQCRHLDRLVIATDDERVIAEAQHIGAEAVLTSPDHPSGTDRCDATIRQLKLRPDVVVNIQGDEPLLHADVLSDLISALTSSSADVATAVAPLTNASELTDPSVVKVTMRTDRTALYFSRSVIPMIRGVEDPTAWPAMHEYWKHIGIYAYRWSALQRHVSLPPSPLERAELLEQLRLLEDGAVFSCVRTDHTFMAVDTPQDADRVRDVLRAQHR